MRVTICIVLSLIVFSCKTDFKETKITIDNYKVEPGFDLDVIASEPLLNTPVAIDFDNKGRIWVAEMPGFMGNIDGTGENLPNGSIKILEDRDEDGVMDHAKIFLDSLVMPRALAIAYGGLLYAEPPNLYFVDIENDKPTNRVLVDSIYAADGNPEYQPNGLKMNIDNWIYNAGSHFRYQRKNGVWIKEPTTFRGQWGITKDNFGRLFYNNNSTQLLGDYILPNRLIRNEFMVPEKGVNQILTKDQRVYPLHAAAVNRGYVKGVLNKDSILIDVTAACGPLVYRGGNFPSDYDENVFVCIPEANLIKRNILSYQGDKVTAKQAWEGKEFLASTDEGFRPVSMNHGPEGNLYVVDMHRGVIQHHAFLSPYLKEKAKVEKLDTLVNFGRIFRIRPTDGKVENSTDLSALSTPELLELLKSKNGWLRDRAQHKLIYKRKVDAVPQLQKMAKNASAPLTQMHAMYTLKGLDSLSFDMLKDVAETSDAAVVSHAIVLLEDYISDENVTEAQVLFEKLASKNDKSIDLYLATTLGMWANISGDKFIPLLNELESKYEGNAVFQEAIVSGTQGVGDELLRVVSKGEGEKSSFEDLVTKNLQRKKEVKKNPIYVTKSRSQDSRTKGAKLYRQICAACHQDSGSGIEGLAPPLVNSEHVTKPEKLALIILHGLKGPIHVNGSLYELNHVMPGLSSNETLSDADISAIISYVGNAFTDYPKGLRPNKVKELRQNKPESGSEYTIEELEAVLEGLP
ncbi:c-type cytochrome [uncultured Kriegella sp.]|uniref:DUF7133 domain-containing protein n=1 Tax=uncultured Kriegella sp. TaxID=1798910 RepID=UPI0030D81DD9